AKQSAKEKINKLENLTFDQKQQYLNRVEESDTVSKIDGVVAEASLQDSKNKAKKDLEQKATDTKAAIDKL
ncbi:hypothetical protein, partial [Leuconostoc citreum]